MNPQPMVPKCSNCGGDLIAKEGKKGIFFTCPNWKPDGSGCKGDMYFPPRESSPAPLSPTLKENGPITHEQGERIIQLLTSIETKLITRDL